ncbi:autotransporter assembly complex protein TamA [Ferrimonas balearica]|uniref:autotransporter assembly complex protein TamA n=1 Tax=Ferrimonas balearica TaxID=44012 RepID=UPI001C9A22A9|nr:autotransporter assembly complex family protein [Ferrimonas balearica]MBY5920901.1 autotransporter assembly complex protein TamA [Ferrimonas balearica]MBY5996414.1 autotransporter assembly complex protein TamA [Ferrimonas balearica]
MLAVLAPARAEDPESPPEPITELPHPVADLTVKVVGLGEEVGKRLVDLLPEWDGKAPDEPGFAEEAARQAEQRLKDLGEDARPITARLEEIGSRWVLILAAGEPEAGSGTAQKSRSRPIRDALEQPVVEGGLELEIEGVKGALARNLRAHLSPLPTSAAERASFLFTLEDKAQEAMQALGYYQAVFSTQIQRTDPNWTLTLTVDRGEPMRYDEVIVLIDGEARDDPAFVARLDRITIKPGDIVNHGQYESLKNDLLTLGLVRGYFDGKMGQHRLEIDRDNNLANLVLLYDSGRRYRLGEVNFWASELTPELLQEMVPFKPGAPYHADEVAKFTSTLLGSGYFQDVKVLPHPEQAEDGMVPIEAGLSPPPRHSIDLGVGYATDTEFRVSTTWRTPVVNRYGHSQETKAEFSKVNPKLSFDYRIPFDHPINDKLVFNASVGREEFGDIESSQYQGSFGRRTVMGNRWIRTVSARLLYEDWTQGPQDHSAKYLMPGLSFSRTQRRGPPLDPTDGLRQFYLLEHADTVWGSDQRITRFRSQLRAVYTPIERHRLTGRVDVGINVINDEDLLGLAPSLRFFAGGDQSIRGFSYQSLGPKMTVDDGEGGTTELLVGGRYLLVGSMEYQYYLTPSWRLAAFVDGGSAFDTNESEAIDFDASFGGGVHWISPVGPIKIEVGYGFTDPDASPMLHISIGAEL